ncbi:MAG: hypothetical protein ACK4V6_21405 [Microthrixaceae bacterium]
MSNESIEVRGAPAPPPPGSGTPPGAAPPPGARHRERLQLGRWLVVALVVQALVVGWLVARVMDLEARTTVQVVDPDPVFTMETTTTALPLDIPPPDGETARRQIRDALGVVFASDLPVEQRAAWVRDPVDIDARLLALSGGPCATGADVVVTDIRFQTDDTAWVRFRFDGPGVPELGRTFSFDGLAHRAPERWLLDGQLVDRVLSMAAPYCD